MPICFVVPGFLGTELWAGPGTPTRVWINYTAIAAGNLTLLQLDENGIGSPPGFTSTIFPRGLIDTYYGITVRTLGEQLAPHGYRVVPWGYDWRLSCRVEGRRLGLAIASAVGPGDPPCAIVAHSQGGLVARCAWRYLVRLGVQSRVRRIVTLGTPHQGSYVSVLGLTGRDTATLAISFLSMAAWGVGALIRNPFRAIYTVDQLTQLMGSWPGMYELLPAIGGSASEGDPDRFRVYESDIYPTAPAAGSRWLNYALFDWWPEMLDGADTFPPANVLTTVASPNFTTVDSLKYDGSRRNRAQRYQYAPDRLGDGTVSYQSANIDASRRHSVRQLHVPMPDALALTGELASYVLEDVPLPPPAPTISGARTVLGLPEAIPPQPLVVGGAGGHDC